MPQDQIDIPLAGARGKGRDDDSSASRFDQTIRKFPRGHGLAIGGQHFPGASEFGSRDQSGCKALILRQIEDVAAIDPVTAKGHRLRLESKGLLRLEPCGLEAQRCVKAGCAWSVEPAPMHSRTLAGFGVEGPPGMMRAVSQPFEPCYWQGQANPPCAMRAR